MVRTIRTVLLAAFILLTVACQSQKGAQVTKVATSRQVQMTELPVEHTDEQVRFDMRKGRIEGDTLYLKVKYGGGCGLHGFSLLCEANQTGVLQLWLLHEAKDDPCRAFVIEELKFNLTPLKAHFDSPVTFTVNQRDETYTYL